jgi:hypothetical protein
MRGTRWLGSLAALWPGQAERIAVYQNEGPRYPRSRFRSTLEVINPQVATLAGQRIIHQSCPSRAARSRPLSPVERYAQGSRSASLPGSSQPQAQFILAGSSTTDSERVGSSTLEDRVLRDRDRLGFTSGTHFRAHSFEGYSGLIGEGDWLS